MKRTWDESNSPQWRYLLSRESERKRQRVSHHYRGGENEMSAIEEAENLFRTSEGEVKRNRPSKKVRQQKMRNNPKGDTTPPQRFTKKGKEILYSASPGRSPSSLPHRKKDLT